MLVPMSPVSDEVLAARRRRRHGGDPRLSPEGRATLRRFVMGDLMDDFQAGLDADAAADPAL